jgi:hypothetical protein
MRASLLLATLVVVGGAVQAQHRANTRKGFWIGFGLGDGSAGLKCDQCETNRIDSWSGYLRMGGTISPSVLLGGETNGWIHSDAASGIDENITFASFIVMWYPSRKGALYLKFGVGGMAYNADDGTDQLTATAPSGSFGLGYEFRVGNNFSITPFLNSLVSSAVTVKINGSSVPTNGDITLSLVQLGLGLTWH